MARQKTTIVNGNIEVTDIYFNTKFYTFLKSGDVERQTPYHTHSVTEPTYLIQNVRRI